MSEQHSNDPLHGVTLKNMLTQLVDHYGWVGLGSRVRIRCFQFDPSMNSSLRFLRRTDWARQEVEGLFLSMLAYQQREKKRAARDRPESDFEGSPSGEEPE